MNELLTVSACVAQGGVEVRVGDFVELSPMPGDDFTRLVQVKALWSEPTQGPHRLLACCHRFYRAPVCTTTYPMHTVSLNSSMHHHVPYAYCVTELTATASTELQYAPLHTACMLCH